MEKTKIILKAEQARRIKILKKILFYLLMTIGMIIVVFPTIYMFSGSLMTLGQIFSTPIRLWPSEFHFENYREVFVRFDLHRYFFNSTLVAIAVIALNVFFCPLVGYSLAKFRFPGRELLFLFILSTMMIPFDVIVIPLFLVIHRFGWVDSYQAVIIPQAMTAFGIFLMRQFIRGTPDDYIDAARIDGCKEFQIFYRIIFPLSMPAITTLVILSFVATWNSFLWPLIVLTSDAKKTLPIALARFLSLYSQEWNLLMAASVIASGPVLILFAFLNKHFIEGMSGLSGLK